MNIVTSTLLPQSNHVVFFVGSLAPEELDDYLLEDRGQKHGGYASRFSFDLRRFYDHDFISAQASPKPVQLSELIAAHNLGDEKLGLEMQRRFGASVLLRCFILLWNYVPTSIFPSAFCAGRLLFVDDWEWDAPFSDD